MDELIGREYRTFDGKRRWELLFEDVRIVILDTGLKCGNDRNLIGVTLDDLRVKWVLGGLAGSRNGYDGIVDVWVRGGQVWAGTWSGFALRLDHRTGEVLEQVFTK